MLTYGASLEEVPPVKEVILEVRMAYMEFNAEAVGRLENKNKLSIAVMYKGEDLAQACGDDRRVSYKMFKKKIDDTSVTLALNSTFQLPFSSAFPMVTPSLEVYVMMENLSNLRKCVASARISLGRRCRSLSWLLRTNSYSLYLGTNSAREAGSVLMNVRLGHTDVRTKSFSFYWSPELRLGLKEPKQERHLPSLHPTNEEDARNTLSILRQTRKSLVEQRIAALSVPISGEPEFNLKGLTSHIDELLVQMERDGVVVVPMITRLKAGDCSAGRFTSFFLDSHPYRILATTSIPFFSPDTVVKAMDGCIRERTSAHGFLGWERCATNTFDYLLDRAVILDTPASMKSSISLGSLPFDRVNEGTQLLEGKQENGEGSSEQSFLKETLEEKPHLPPVRHSYLNEIRSSLDKWRERCHFRRLPPEHPLRIFALFKRDQLFVSGQAIGGSRSGLLLAILVLGDEKVDMEEASKVYGVEIQAQRMMNEAIVELKRHSAEGSATGSRDLRLTSLTPVLMTTVDYKGFRVVVIPLPESVPEIVAWPQPLSARVRHEISFIETKLNICNLLKAVSPESPPHDVTVLLSVKNRGIDMMMLYRTCYALPLFSGKEASDSLPSISQRLRTVPFEYSADMEMALKNCQQTSQQTPVKPTVPGRTYQDAIVRSPFSRLYAPMDELVHFITHAYSRSYRGNVEPVVCGSGLSGRKAQRLGTLVKSVILDDVIAELERMEPYGPYDSISLTNFLHRRGINIRLLARTLKQLLKGVFRRLVFCTNPELQASGTTKVAAAIGSLLRAGGREADVFKAANDNDGDSVANSDDSSNFEELIRGQEGGVRYSKESLLREKFLKLPLSIATRLLDDSPYLLDLTRHKFRIFFWTDLVVLNLFNVAIGSCMESHEFWRNFLSRRCSELFDIEASMVRRHRIYLPALYISLQHHCGITFFPCAATLSRMLDKPFPLMPSHIRDSWDVEEATVELVGVALRYEAWDVGHLLAQRCILQYPEAHAASVPARLLLLLAATHGSEKPPPSSQLAATAYRIQRLLEYHWGGHHPATLDVTVAQAWLSYLGRDWRECISGLQAAVSLSAALSVSQNTEDLTSLKLLLAVIATDEASKDLVTEEQKAQMANSACLMLQWALDAYDFHFGTRHVLTMTAAREFSLSLLLLIEYRKSDAGGTILQRGVEIATKTLQWQTIILGKHHLETLATGQLLAVLLANQGRYRRCIAMYEAVIRNAFIRLTHKPSLRRYRPDNEFSRVCWCLPDPYFYGIFETIRPINRFFSKVKFVLPNLEDEQALVSLNNQKCGDPTPHATVDPVEPPHVSASSINEPKPGTADEKHDAASPPAQKDVSKANMIQLDPTDHPIFPCMQSKAASDMVSPVISDLVSDMFVVYINFAVDTKLVSRLVSLFLLLDYLEKQTFKTVSYDVFKMASAKSGGDITSHSFLTWLLDLSGTSAVQVMEYIEHYPYRIPKEELFDQDSDVIFLLCHPTGRDNKGTAYNGCIMDRYLGHLLEKSEAAVSKTCQLILSGDSKRLSEVAQSYSFPLEKLNRAVSRLRVIFLMLGKLKEKAPPEKNEPDDRDIFKRQSVEHGLTSQQLEETVKIGGSFFEQLAENASETSSRTEMRRRYRHFLAHIRTTLRLPTNLRCEELDILANIMYYFLDIKTFQTWWENRRKSCGGPTAQFSRGNNEEVDPTVAAFEEY
ncbi:hypothetical protein, conserved [Eimeria brunetti]|uniref:CLU central domain-containing protein n=1 Tax=Eimeria brunetti TaxID=51314 RepID=U6LWB9_9EIME|nr:hypothetical protein, conserved [Eimeria brunetti]